MSGLENPSSSTKLHHRYDPFEDFERRYAAEADPRLNWEYHVVPLGERQKKLIVWATKTIYLDRDVFIEDPEFSMANAVAHVDGHEIPSTERDRWADAAARLRLYGPEMPYL